ncbi:MAG: response regulator [Cyclobacteriaceae bacterium]
MKKILVVEDEANIRETLADILEVQGYHVVQAPNGLIGSIKAVKEAPDLIICDINMPEMDGFEMLESLMICMEEDLIPPFIFLTARVNQEDIRRGMNLGADDYITKPFSNKDLIEAVRVKLEKRADFQQKILSKERSKISGELHDNIQQLLVASLMGFESLNSNISALPQKDLSLFKSSIGLLRQAAQDLRSFSHAIDQSEQSVDFEKKLKLFSETIQEVSGLKMLTTCTIGTPIKPAIQTQLLRIIQEATNNVLKHAKATQTTIELLSNESEIRLLITDDGLGFDTRAITDGTGLTHLKKRTVEMDGDLKIHSALGKGTTIELLLKLNREK